ncbi:TetR/AcrR family transcriptional regulator [Actinocorallia sp. B10E7]|uniref:TetR/AcrR family transcriptional regulator n=1 Tax=Actinocorallia sp. B10E7 TaxID=3153558 RepID=UPI00325D4C43
MPKIQAATVVEHRAMQRRAILNAARDILAQGGSETPSLAAVAKRTGLARSSIYQYFSSKDDLLEAVIVDMFPRWAAYVTARVEEADTPADRALAYVDANLHLVASGEHAIARGLASFARAEVLAESSKVLHDQLRTPLDEALIALGCDDPGTMGELIQAVVQRASVLLENGTLSEDRARALTHELLEPYLRRS